MKRNEIFNIIAKEYKRQNNGLELIASENYTSKNVRKACGSILTNKYAEGYPNARYYGGCKYVDLIEDLAIKRACKLFNVKYANVQPHSGSQANAAAYRALLPNGGKILAMQLNDGGHLTHGSNVSFSSHLYDFCFFDLNNGKIDLNYVEQKIIEEKPDLLLAGCSAYPYEIDFKGLGDLAKKYNLLYMVDMAHVAGLVATGFHQNPCLYADVVTSTTHKTLRGPRGGLILTNDEKLIKKINSAVFPYYQGGPLEHIIAGKAICFEEALKPEFKTYIKNVIDNTKAFTDKMKELGAVCSLTENHLMLLDVKKSFNITGLEAQNKLEEIGITVNKNMIPNDTESPKTTSGLRIGFAALTTRGCTPDIAVYIAGIIYYYLNYEINYYDAKTFVQHIVKKLKNIKEV